MAFLSGDVFVFASRHPGGLPCRVNSLLSNGEILKIGYNLRARVHLLQRRGVYNGIIMRVLDLANLPLENVIPRGPLDVADPFNPSVRYCLTGLAKAVHCLLNETTHTTLAVTNIVTRFPPAWEWLSASDLRRALASKEEALARYVKHSAIWALNLALVLHYGKILTYPFGPSSSKGYVRAVQDYFQIRSSSIFPNPGEMELCHD